MVNVLDMSIWSDEQLKAFDWFSIGKGNLVIDAVAGSGKTTTLIQGVLRAPEQTVLLCAFNKRIQEELTKRIVPQPRRLIVARTLHAEGLKVIRQFWGFAEVDADAIVDLLDRCLPKGAKGRRKKQVRALVSAAKEYGAHTREDLRWLSFCIDQTALLFEDDRQVAIEDTVVVLEASREKRKTIDFGDMVWLPAVMDWVPKERYRMVVVDECQDMSPAQVSLAEKLLAPGGRLVVVGDRHQGIYGWRGADITNLDRMAEKWNATRLPLTITFRCPQAVVKEAQRIVPQIRARPDAPEGSVQNRDYRDLLAYADPGDYVLSRLNAPLLRALLEAKLRKVTCYLEGAQATLAPIQMLCQSLLNGHDPSTADRRAFSAQLHSWYERELARAEELSQPDYEDRVTDTFNTIDTCLTNLGSVEKMFSFFSSLLTQRRAGIVYSSIHRAKGLEAQKVFILKETLRQYDPGRPRGEDGEPIPLDEEELNIEYVGITRAIDTLIWISGVPSWRKRKEG